MLYTKQKKIYFLRSEISKVILYFSYKCFVGDYIDVKLKTDMGIESFREWLSLMFRKIGGVKKRDTEPECEMDELAQTRLLRFYSSTNYELPETLCDTQGNNTGCENLIFFIDITQILIKSYQKPYFNKADQHNCENNFERYIVSRIVSQLSNLSTNICPICNQRSSGFNSWNYSSQKRDSVNDFDAPKPEIPNVLNSSTLSNYNMNAPCKCASSLSISEVIYAIYKYLSVNNNKSYRIVLLYDSRNLNPLSRSITHDGRYKQVTNITNSDIEKWFEQNPGSKELGYGKYMNHDKCVNNVPTIPYTTAKSFESDEFFSGYIKTRFLLFTIESWLIKLQEKVTNTMDLLEPIKNTNDPYKRKFVGEFDQSQKFEFIIDSLPTRAYQMYARCCEESVFSFREKNFIKNFKIFYGDTVGITQEKISFFAKKMISKIGNVRTSETFDDYNYIPSDSIAPNLCLVYPGIYTDEEDGNQENISLCPQNESVTGSIGESDIKMLPYIKSFLDNVVDKSKDPKSTFRIVVNSEDSDIILISLLYVSNCSSTDKMIGRFVVNNKNIFKDKRLSFVIDRGVKSTHNNYKKMESESEKTESTKKFLRLAGQSAMMSTADTNENLSMFDIDEDQIDIYEEKIVPKKSAIPKSTNEHHQNVTTTKKAKVIEPENMTEKDVGNIRMVDIIGLYDAMSEHFPVSCIETFIFLMFMSGSDYTEHPGGMGIKKFITVFENYADTKPFYLFSKSSSEDIIRYNHLSVTECVSNEPHHGEPLVRTIKNDMSYMWVCNEERVFVFGILLYLTRLPALFNKIKKDVQTKLDLKMKGLTVTDTTVRSIYENFRAEVLKKNGEIDYFWSSQKFLGEMHRCTWVINYYLGTEFFSSHSTERKMGCSMWGWVVVPVINSGTIVKFDREFINFLESHISLQSDVLFDDGLTAGDALKTISSENHQWKKYLLCLDCLVKISEAKKEILTWSIVRDDYLVLDHSCL